MTQVTQQGFPQISSPLINMQTGIISQTWLQLLISLWNRTGGQQGSIQAFVTGDMKAIAGPSIPSGWLLCDGSAVSRSNYSALFSVIGTTWGIGDGSTTFNIPNLSGKAPISTSMGHALGTQGGAETTTLTVGNLPSHNHGVTDPGHTHAITDSGHTHAITDPGHHHTAATVGTALTSGSGSGSAASGNTGDAMTGITVNSATTGITNDSATTGITTQDTGSADPVSIMSPYATVQWVIKY